MTTDPMPKPRTNAGWPAVILIAVVALLPVAYAGLYVLRCEQRDAMGRDYRKCHSQWEATIFTPAAKVEGWLIGRKILLAWPSRE